MKLAQQLIDTLAGEWDPREYKDTYTDVLKRVIEAKVGGKAVKLAELPRPARVTNLMDALKKSLAGGERRRELTRAAGRRPAARASRARRRAAA